MQKFKFTQQKFGSLSFEQQHKKCAELLAQLFLNPDFAPEYASYRKWLNLEPLEQRDQKTLSDLYHWHLGCANQFLKEHNLLPRVKQGDRNKPIAPPLPIAIYLDHIRSAHNVGSIIRTTEFFSLGTLYFSEQTPPTANKKVKDAAMGSEDWISCIYDRKLEDLPRPIIALETTEAATPLYEFSFPSSFTLVVGNEEYGCSDEALSMADACVEIPAHGRKNSLNVANAFAIAAGEIRRQTTIIP